MDVRLALIDGHRASAVAPQGKIVASRSPFMYRLANANSARTVGLDVMHGAVERPVGQLLHGDAQFVGPAFDCVKFFSLKLDFDGWHGGWPFLVKLARP